MTKTPPKIAIIMRSYNDRDVIGKTLEMLTKQTMRTFELWNFASQSNDGTLEIIRRFNHADRIIVNDPATYNPGRVLNEAVATVKADILVFLNSDATPVDEHWLERLIEPLQDPTVGAVFGRQVARPDCRSLFVKDTERAFGDGSESSRWLHFFSMANSAARSSVLRRFPFEEAVQYSEDIEWSYRLRRGGFRTTYAARSVAMHSHNYTLRQSWKRHRGEGVADAFIFRDAAVNHGWLRTFLLPFGMEVLRDVKWAASRRSADALLHTVPLRFVQKWARWTGVRAGRLAPTEPLLPVVAGKGNYTFDGNDAAERRIAADQELIRGCVAEAVPAEHFEALVLMGGYGRAEGGYQYVAGMPAPYNDYDYFVVVKGLSKAEARELQQNLKQVAAYLDSIVGVEVDLAVLRSEALPEAPLTLMNVEMKWGHRVLAGPLNVLDAMPGVPFDKLALGEFTRLMNNRGALLLMNARRLSEKKPLNEAEREQVFKYQCKALLACGDARLALEGIYHPSYRRKLERLRKVCGKKDAHFMQLYRRALAYKFRPRRELFETLNLGQLQGTVTAIWLKTLQKLETQRTQREFPGWSRYAGAVVPKGQLEGSVSLRNLAITARDFGVGHTLRYLLWALRYPRERLISVLPLLLWESSKVPAQVKVPLALNGEADWPSTVDRYLHTWQRYA